MSWNGLYDLCVNYIMAVEPKETFFKIDDLIVKLNEDLGLFGKKPENAGTEMTKELKPSFDAFLKTVQTPDAQTIFNACIAQIDILYKMMNLQQNESYFHEVHYSQKPPAELNDLWILRTYLFFAILILTFHVASNEEVFKLFYTPPSDPMKLVEPFKRTWSNGFNQTVGSQLEHFKLGLFGSMNATSDIDLGLQYCQPEAENFVAGLAYIVSIIEDAFIITTGCTSLDFDIECYGNITFMRDSEKKQDFYYLDSSQLTEAEYNKLLRYAGASILRNYYMSHDILVEDRNLKWAEPTKVSALAAIQTYVEAADDKYPFYTLLKGKIAEKDKILEMFGTRVNTLLNAFTSQSLEPPVIELTHSYVFPDSRKTMNATGTINDEEENGIKDLDQSEAGPTRLAKSLTSSQSMEALTPTDITKANEKRATYNARRELYYQYLFAGDFKRQKVYKKVIKNEQLDLKEILECIESEAHSNLMREESYLLAPTVMHVVRTLQKYQMDHPYATIKDVLKYQTSFPACKEEYKGFNAYCNIGKFGYYLSILEQLGYMARFYNTYCVGKHLNTDKCNAKLKKYGERLVDAVMALDCIEKSDCVETGGSKSRKNKNKKTRKSKGNKKNATRRNRRSFRKRATR